MSDSIDSEFEERQLCPDDTCIGVIGQDGLCAECGALGESAQTPPLLRAPSEGVDSRHRSLCADGGCIGLIGPDGRCKECGLVDDDVLSDPRLRGSKPTPEPPEPEEVSPDLDLDPEEPGTDLEAAWDSSDRKLCPDGCCIGVIGDAGLCNECGAEAA